MQKRKDPKANDGSGELFEILHPQTVTTSIAKLTFWWEIYRTFSK